MATTSADILVRAVMQGDTGLPADVFVNDFAFHFIAGTAPTSINLTALFGCVDSFYNDVQASGFSVSKFIGEAVDRTATHEFQAYNIAAGGSPVFTLAWLGPGAPGTANVNMPTEVSAVLSFHANLTGLAEESGATRPRARRRGRVFVGPLTTDAVSITDDDPRLQTSILSTLRQAAIDMHDEAVLAGFTWSVWSRAEDTLFPIVGGWTDNAPDTQRRRGATSTARVTYTV